MAEICSGELPGAQRAAAFAGGSGAHVTFNVHIPCSSLCPPSEVIVSDFEPCGGGTEALRVVGERETRSQRCQERAWVKEQLPTCVCSGQ